MSRWDGGCDDLVELAGGGASALRSVRWGVRPGHHHEAPSDLGKDHDPGRHIKTKLDSRPQLKGRFTSIGLDASYYGTQPATRLEQVGEELSKGMKDRNHRFSRCNDSARARKSRPDGFFGKDTDLGDGFRRLKFGPHRSIPNLPVLRRWRISGSGYLGRQVPVSENKIEGNRSTSKPTVRRIGGTLDLPMGDKRSKQRLRTLKGGSIIYGLAAAIDCIIRNMSQTGACLEVNNTVGIPDDFTLLIKPEFVKRNCHVAWRSLQKIGVQFT